MKKITDESSGRILAICICVFFIVLGIIDMTAGRKDLMADRFFIAFLALVSFFLYKKLHMNIIMLVGLAAVVLHSIKLYGNNYFGIPFDHYMHVVGGFACALIFYNYLNHELKKKNHLQAFFLAVCITAGLGSFMEIMEFVGYSLLGQGGGVFFYGAGDIGEWNNAAWDMINNSIGAIVASFTCFLVDILKDRNRR